jgi:hypothetical protein
MKTGRPIAPRAVSNDARRDLESVDRSSSLPHTIVQRAQSVLMSTQGTVAVPWPGLDPVSRPWRGMRADLAADPVEGHPGRPADHLADTGRMEFIGRNTRPAVRCHFWTETITFNVTLYKT